MLTGPYRVMLVWCLSFTALVLLLLVAEPLHVPIILVRVLIVVAAVVAIGFSGYYCTVTANGNVDREKDRLGSPRNIQDAGEEVSDQVRPSGNLAGLQVLATVCLILAVDFPICLLAMSTPSHLATHAILFVFGMLLGLVIFLIYPSRPFGHLAWGAALSLVAATSFWLSMATVSAAMWSGDTEHLVVSLFHLVAEFGALLFLAFYLLGTLEQIRQQKNKAR